MLYVYMYIYIDAFTMCQIENLKHLMEDRQGVFQLPKRQVQRFMNIT